MGHNGAMPHLTGLLGIGVFVLIGWLMSQERSRIDWRTVLIGIALQALIGVLILRVPGVREAFDLLARLVAGVIGRADAGIAFLFGTELLDPGGPWGFVFAIKVLPVIIFFASLMAVLYYLGVMQRIISALAWALQRTLRVSGAEALAMASNIFVGQTEAPLTIKPLIAGLTRAQLMTLMVGGFATIAGSVLAGYIGLLGGADEASRAIFAKHLITASVMSAPAAFVMARLLVPETGSPSDERIDALATDERETATNLLDAAALGASDGLRLALNVGAMLIAFVALLAIINWPLEAFSAWEPVARWREANGVPAFSLQQILGWLFAPLAWCMGIAWSEAAIVGSLLGEKLIATEFVAYASLGGMLHDGSLSARSAQIAAYALCGFANFASIAIQIGGLTAIAPSRRRDFAELALPAMVGGAMASGMTASIAGVLIQ